MNTVLCFGSLGDMNWMQKSAKLVVHFTKKQQFTILSYFGVVLHYKENSNNYMEKILAARKKIRCGYSQTCPILDQHFIPPACCKFGDNVGN